MTHSPMRLQTEAGQVKKVLCECGGVFTRAGFTQHIEVASRALDEVQP